MIDKRQKAVSRGADDLLGLLMESNSRSIQENGNKKGGMSIEDVMEEMKLFYFAGSETTSSLLVWTMLQLCIHPDWQSRAREEVKRILGDSEPTLESLNRLRTVRYKISSLLGFNHSERQNLVLSLLGYDDPARGAEAVSAAASDSTGPNGDGETRGSDDSERGAYDAADRAGAL